MRRWKKKKIEAERKKAEEVVRFKANLLKAVGQAVIATDLSGTVLYWNYTAENIYGWLAEETMGRNIMDITPTNQTREQAEAVMAQLQQGNSWSGEFTAQKKDGTHFPVYVSNSPFFDQEGNLSGMIGISYDLTAQKEAEARMRAMEKKMARQQVEEQKKISRAIIRGQEAEKNHIGKELHDNINQILAGAKMFLISAGKKNPEVKELVSYPIELLGDSIEEIRRLTYRQVTPLKDIMLQEQLRKLFESVQQTTPVNIHLDFNLEEQAFSDELKLNLYRIVQEQVGNIVKHAAANKIRVSVSKQEDRIVLSVADDGKGFDTAAKRKGIGISNIINRVTSYNGALDINSRPGQGTVLTASIPY